METQITFLGMIISIGIAVVILGVMNRKRQRQWLTKRFTETFGTIPDKKISSERYAQVPGYCRRHTKAGQIDDITWNDLDMDAIYHRIDNTCSSAGEEYLYYSLRTPAVTKDEADENLYRLTGLMGEESRADDRIRLQLALHELGGTGKYSLFEYLDLLGTLGTRSNTKHYIAILMPVAAVAVMFLHVETGILLLIAALIGNMLTYFREKREIEPFIVSFRYLLRLMHCAESIAQMKIPGMEPESEELSRLTEAFAGFRRGAGIVMSQSQTGSGNPIDVILDYIRILLHLDLIKFNTMYADVMQRRDEIDGMVTVIGRIDAAISVASFRKSLPAWCRPQLEEKPVSRLQITGLYHPLLADPVVNSITADRSVLLTGSNASGKSTFLKAVALCALLGQSIDTCPASGYAGEYFRICSSMALRDNLTGGDSYFMVEIKSLKRILDTDGNLLCFIDEVLRGTNTIERIAASAEILKTFAGRGTLCFAATHDIELTELLADAYDNYHFEEELQGGDVVFSYQLHPGRATTRNAIHLLGAVGFDRGITERAAERAGVFELTGTWKS